MKTFRTVLRVRCAGGLARSTLPLLLLPLACDTATAPSPPGVTLHVMNATCALSACTALEVRGFPENQPGTPGGFWSMALGVVDSEAGCLVLPAADTFRVINAGTNDTTLYLWSSHEPLALGVLLPGENVLKAGPSTDLFVPAEAQGWSVTLPGGAVSAAQACGSLP